MANSKSGSFMSKFSDLDITALKHLTSKQFLEVWNNYDQDGNGYIEGSELDNFLREFVSSISSEKESLDEKLLSELKEAFMNTYDNNRDGRIDIRELAQMLPLEEGFKLLFKFENQVDSSVEFMRIWTKYDTDSSGYIDAQELRSFLRDLMRSNGSNSARASHGSDNPSGQSQTAKSNLIDEEKLDEYTETLLKIFDSNKDGKLQLNEMSRLLLVKKNLLHCSGIFRGTNKKPSKQDIEHIFNSYDRDGNGVIENEELKGFIKDLMDFLGKAPDTSDIEEFERMVMEGCDSNNDGKINKKEITAVLLALAKYAYEEENSTAKKK